VTQGEQLQRREWGFPFLESHMAVILVLLLAVKSYDHEYYVIVGINTISAIPRLIKTVS
jgi:hypothetical protein